HISGGQQFKSHYPPTHQPPRKAMNFPVYSVLTIMSLVSVALLRDHEDPEDIAHRGCPRGVPVKRIEIKGPCDEPGCDAFVDNKNTTCNIWPKDFMIIPEF
ncbi:hypothetical protein PCANC_22642, partial [Puccinia coronata f. sp. avenae]